MVPLSCNNVSTYLLFAFSFNNCLGNCNPTLTKNLEVFTKKNMRFPEVETKQGIVRGVNMVSLHNRKFFGFKGIPFAQPPVGNFRFKGPVPADPWNGILDASRESNRCPQLEGNAIVGDEDCLYLNVYTPRLPTRENFTLLPVMMFVYGGGFKTGTNNPARWGPQFILDKDVVLIVPNYRMGVLGYLSTGDEVLPGNYGLKDLVQVLKWNQDNIRYFGGDPNQVTIFGGSSGAISVHLLTLSSLTNGLFHRYITQSGSALAHFSVKSRRTFVNQAIQLGTHLGCPTDTSTSLVKCLRSFHASQLVNTSSMYYMWNVFPYVIWGPTVEPDIKGALLTDTPANLFTVGKIRDLPWISSITRDDGLVSTALFHAKPDVFQAFLDKVDFVLPIILQYDGSVDNVTAFTAALKSYYLNDLSADKRLLLNNLTQLLGDAEFCYPGYIGIRRQLVHAKNPQYLGSFEYRGTVSYSYFFTGGLTKNWGVAHGDELLYLLPGPKSLFGPPGYKVSESDRIMVETMVQLWTSFAINGTPTALTSHGNIVWEPYSSRDNYLQIGNGLDTTLQVKYGFFEDRMRFWEELYAATTWYT